MRRGISVGEIKDYYVEKHYLTYPHTTTRKNAARQKIPMSSQYQQRNEAFSKKYPRFRNSKESEYGLGRLKGLLVHDTIRTLVGTNFTTLHLLIPQPIDVVKLWVTLDLEAYSVLIKTFPALAQRHPLASVYEERLLYNAMQDVRTIISHEFNRIVPRLNRGQKLKGILRGYTQILQEKDQFITYRGIKIHFKPDWVDPAPERIYLTDFKTGLKPETGGCNEVDRIQVLLYAWCLEKLLRQPTTMELFYTSYNHSSMAEFNPELQTEAQHIVDEYLVDNNNITTVSNQTILTRVMKRQKQKVQSEGIFDF